ncbi:dna-binding protein rfx2 isoform 4 [Moniliophthora roreri MCA 2997]|uniref:Dna-binding protein rfx2 isoform 4 n=2 Tax=Moniliophthora roreri TaxID=221103 RepID=V2XT25_MONRO|nr:dna-binding protein rfx2 isoform 4 [Moniliophthora roreri MCA 2997]KAI3612111.1 dna-binding protein rfx2 isoform 4 [Moniliophthora roreri]
MAAVNMPIMSASMPLDFLPVHSHSRSNSVSSNSTHSASSRPQSSQGGLSSRMQPPIPPSAEDIYRATYQHNPVLHGDPSPPNHNITNPALKNHLRPSHYRARAAASPYPRDTDSVHSSSSETDDISMYLGSSAPEYHQHNMYGGNSHTMTSSQDAIHAAGAFGRMTLNSDQALEKLAANVRAATTTSASDRAKQIFVQAWLTANYAPYPDGNVPRQGLYFSYRRVCDHYGIPHINTATLGKAIRLCFPTIKTRRLGVRGNSKYHYCGIRPATSAEAEWLQDYIQKTNNHAGQSSVNAANRLAQEQSEAANRSEERSDEDDDDDSESAASGTNSKRNSLTLDAKQTFSADLSDKTPTAALLSHQQRPTSSTFPPQASIRRHPQAEPSLPAQASTSASPSSYLSTNTQQPVSVRQFPHFPSIEEAVGANSTSPHGMAAREVWNWFQDHLDLLLDNVRSFRFDQFEINLRTFWSGLAGTHREIVHAPAIAGLMAKADAIVYDEILEILRSQMLSPIPLQSLTNLRQFANKMEKILLVALNDYGNTFVEPKVELGARFGHLVLRFLDIYQVTQALNTVLTNQKQLAEMRRSWQKVDFESVRNQSALVCNCRHEDLVQLLEVEFVAMMDSLTKTTEPVREVMSWADKCCDRLMGSVRGSHGAEDRSTMSSRSVLIRWGYVTSQVMRDLTIRSDPAFGAFQILKLFLDDWIAVNVLRSVALSTNSVAASVEPMMQQQLFSLSPMAGQESFNAMDVRPQHLMANTPTTSSMLAALQNDTFNTSIDPGASFNPDSYGSLSYMDTSASQDNSLTNVHSSDLSFPDFSGPGNSFDVGFSQDMGLQSSATPGSESEHESEVVKTE